MLTPAQLPALKTEIAFPAYEGLSEPDIATALNTKNISADVDIQIELIHRRLIGQGILGKIDARIAYYVPKVGAEVAVNSAVEGKLATLYNARTSLEFLPSYEMTNGPTKTFVSNMLTDLVAEGVLTNPQRTALLVLADGLISRAEQLFGRGTVIDSGDVSRAKKV